MLIAPTGKGGMPVIARGKSARMAGKASLRRDRDRDHNRVILVVQLGQDAVRIHRQLQLILSCGELADFDPLAGEAAVVNIAPAGLDPLGTTGEALARHGALVPTDVVEEAEAYFPAG